MAMLRERAVPRGPQEGELRVWARTARTGRWLGEGFKGLLCGDVSLPRWLTPWPLPARGNRAPFPPASPPSDRTRAPYLGKGTKSEQSVGGCPRHSPRASGMERAGAGQRAGGGGGSGGTAGKGLLWTGPCRLPRRLGWGCSCPCTAPCCRVRGEGHLQEGLARDGKGLGGPSLTSVA